MQLSNAANRDSSGTVEQDAANRDNSEAIEQGAQNWPLYYRLMQACWRAKKLDRPAFQQVAAVLKLAKSFSGDATNLTTALKEEAAEAAAAAEDISFDAFLEKAGLQGRERDLADYLSEAGQEIIELKQMDEQDLIDDILDDGDLGLTEAQKQAFQAAAAELRQPFDAAAAAEKREEKYPKWESLLELLGAVEDKQLQLGEAEGQLGHTRSKHRGRFKSAGSKVRAVATLLAQKKPVIVS